MSEIYKCKISKNMIAINFTNVSDSGVVNAFIENMYVDYEYGKLFFVLLNKTVKIMKERNVDYVSQRVRLSDWKTLKDNNKWEYLVTFDRDSCIIRCKLDDLTYCIGNALGCD